MQSPDKKGGDILASVLGTFFFPARGRASRTVYESITAGTGVLSPKENTLFLPTKYNIYPIYFYVFSYILKGNIFSIKRVHARKEGK